MAPIAHPVFRVRTEDDLKDIPFKEGLAAVEVPVEILGSIEFRNEERGESPRLDALRRSIRARGYQPLAPITARIGRRGRWVIVDGGNRLRAAQEVSREFWSNILGPKVGTLYFVLFLTPDSWSRGGAPPSRPELPLRTGQAAASRDAWERADARRQIADLPRHQS